jgi:hypothetical protein
VLVPTFTSLSQWNLVLWNGMVVWNGKSKRKSDLEVSNSSEDVIRS